MRLRTLTLAFSIALVGALGACGGDQQTTIRAEPATTTTTVGSSSTTSTSLTTTSTKTSAAGVGQVVTFGGLEFVVPASWPVHDLAAAPRTCVRADQHAVFLGEQGDNPDCPARLVGHTETLWIAPLSDRHQVDAARATTSTTIDGIPVRLDPNPEPNGALTAIFTNQRLLVIITFGDARSVADDILASARVTS